jgi:exosortase
VALVLQNFASIVAVSLFDVTGIAALREGVRITIPNSVPGESAHIMEVGAACSGLRSLTAILALAVAIAYLSGRRMWYRAVVVLMAAPVAIAVNCIRVFGTGLIMLYIGPQWATGDAHEQQGMVMVGVAAAILAFVAWILAGLEDWYLERSSKPPEDDKALKPALDSN